MYMLEDALSILINLFRIWAFNWYTFYETISFIIYVVTLNVPWSKDWHQSDIFELYKTFQKWCSFKLNKQKIKFVSEILLKKIMIDWVSIVRHSRRRFSNYVGTRPMRMKKRRRTPPSHISSGSPTTGSHYSCCCSNVSCSI